MTDANLVLGRIGPANPIGREAGWEFDRKGAEAAIAEKIRGAAGDDGDGSGVDDVAGGE